MKNRFHNIYNILNGLKTFNLDYVMRIVNLIECMMSRRRISLTSQPFYVQIETTTACNLECRFCPRQGIKDINEFLPYDRFVQILDSLPRLILINLQGAGEPFLNKDIFRMASEARKRGIYVVSVTNLNLPEQTVNKIAESDFNKINISIESTDPATYEWFRTGGNLSLVENNLELLNDLKNRNGNAPKIGLWSFLTKKSIDSIETIFQFAKKFQIIEAIQFQLLQSKENYVDVYRDVPLSQHAFFDNKTAKDKAADVIRRYSKSYGINATLASERCKWPWQGFFINVKGLSAPCCYIKDYQKPFWGDMESCSLDTLWCSQEWEKLRKGLLTGIPHPACKDCPYF